MVIGDFLAKILPKGGKKILAIQREGFSGFVHLSYESVSEMASAALRYDAKGDTVYHACNGFGELTTVTKSGKVRIKRSQQNVIACRSLYLDIDVGKSNDNKSYNTREEALADVKRFLKAVDLPAPMIVSSGMGLHLYWPFEDDLSVQQWADMAFALQQSADHLGFKVDSTSTNDSARVLRPVGTTWRKYGTEREVKVVRDAGPFDSKAIHHTLTAYTSANMLMGTAAALFTDNDDLTVRVDYPPSSLALVAKHCAQLGHFRDTGSSIGEPQWHKCIGVAKHCVDGEKLAHEWGSKYEGYNYNDTEFKLNNWSFGPSTCEMFRREAPQLCQGCQHEVKSPIQLGYAESTVVEPTAVISDPGAASDETVSKYPEGWSDKFDIVGNTIVARVKDEETGLVKMVSVCSPVVWPVTWLRLEDGTLGIHMKFKPRENVVREFDMPAKALGDARSTRGELASRGIIVNNDKQMAQYLASYAEYMHKVAAEKNTYNQMGWKDDFAAFLIGDTLITRDQLTKVRLGDNFQSEMKSMFNPKGSADAWAAGVNELYNRENGEPYQYTVCSAFGSILTPLMRGEEWHGIPLALTSDESGLGKSTVGKIALSVYANPTSYMVTDSTVLAALNRVGELNNLPFMYDEITKRLEGAQLADILYILSNGKGRERMTQAGKAAKASPGWNSMSILTGNKGIMFQLSESKVNPESTQMRVFEISMDMYERMDTMKLAKGGKETSEHMRHQGIAQDIMSNHSGAAGLKYIQFVIANVQKIENLLRSTFESVAGNLAEQGGHNSKERFYAYHIACTLVGGAIAKKIGLINFDMSNLRKWATNHVKRLRGLSQEYVYSHADKFAMLLDDLVGFTLVTKEMKSLDSRKGIVEAPLMPLRGAVKARCVIGTNRERPQLYIAVSAFDEWCKEQGINPSQFRSELHKMQFIREFSSGGKTVLYDRMRLSKGVPTITSASQRIIEVNYYKAVEQLPDDWRSAEVVELPSRVDGEVTEEVA